MTQDEESEAYRLLTECEDPTVQDKLNDWEREFLAGNMQRKVKNLPIVSDKVIAVLRKIAAYKYESERPEPTDRFKGSRRYEGFGGRGRR